LSQGRWDEEMVYRYLRLQYWYVQWSHVFAVGLW
jgi:hypothetical protein